MIMDEGPFFRSFRFRAATQPSYKDGRNSNGLTKIHEPGQVACMEVVLLHGLEGTSHDTWTYRDPLYPWKRFFWPIVFKEDPVLQAARVWTYGYDAAVSAKLFEKSAAGIPDFARDLLFKLKCELVDVNVPVVFIAHSMGGLVAKEAYLSRLDEYRAITKGVRGFVFLGTPHKGSEFANILTKILGSLRLESKPFIDDLRQNSPELADLNIRFRDHILSHPLENLHLFSLYETRETKILNKFVVQLSSAKLDVDGELLIPVSTNHQDLVRFSGRDSDGLESILQCLKICIREEGPWNPSVSMLPSKEKRQLLYQWLGTRSLEGEAMPYFLDRSFPGTCNWIEAEPAFADWMSDKIATPNTLWVSGQQGSGKSMVASFVAHLIEQKRPCTFSFQEQDTPQQSLVSLLGSLAFQLAHRSRKFCHHLVALARNGDRLNLYTEWPLWTTVFLHELLQFKAEYKHPIYWIIDGLDMCASPDVLIDGLNYLSTTPVPLRIIILSRWTESIDDQYRKMECRKAIISLDESPAAKDALKGFITGKLSCSRSEASGIMDWAQGNFYLASLFITHALQASKTDLHTIMETVQPDDSILHAVISSMTRRWTADESRAATNVLQIAAYSKSPMTVSQISELLSLDGIDGFGREDIERLCGQLVAIDEQCRIQLRQTAVRSFLRRKGIRDFCLDPEATHEKFLKLCLQTFQNLDVAAPDPLRRPGSFQDYALASWTFHLDELTPTKESLLLLEDFLNGRQVEPWICLLAEINLLDLAISASATLARFRRKIPKTIWRENLDHLLLCWSNELPGIIGRFSGPLLKYPRAIGEIVPPFCPGDSLLRTARGRGHDTDRVVVRGIAELHWDDTLAQIAVPRKPSMITRSHSYIAVACSDKVIIFSTSTFAKVQTYFHEELIQKIRFSSCGEMLAVYGNRTLKVSKIGMTRPWTFPTSPQTCVLDLTFTPDNHNVLVCEKYGDILKYQLTEDCREGIVIGSVCHTDGGKSHGYVRSAAFDGTGTILATACSNLPISVWKFDLSAPEPISRPCRQRTPRFLPGQPHDIKVRQLDWIPNSNRILSVNEDGSAWIWDKELQDEYLVAHSALGVTCIKSSPCGSFLVTSSRTSLKVWHAESQMSAYEGKFNEQMKDFIICSRSRAVFRLCEEFIEVWGPNCLSQLSVTHTWGCPEAAALGTRAGPESGHLSVEALAVGTRTFVHCSAHSGGGLTVFGADGQTSSQIPPPYYRVVRTITWSDNEENLAVADDAQRLYVYRVSQGQPLDVRDVDSAKLGDSPCQILFNQDATSILSAGEKSVALWRYEKENLQFRCRIQVNQRLHWINYPKSSEELLLGFGPTTVSVFRWQNLECLTVLHLSLSSSLEPLQGDIEPDQNNLVTNVIISGDKSQILIQNSASESSEALELILVGTSDINAAWHGQTQALKVIRYSSSLVKSVDIPLGLVTTDICGRTESQQTGYVLAFLDKRGWLCTMDLAGTLCEHCFLPRDWLRPCHLKLAKIAKDGTLFIPKQGSVAIVSNGFHRVIQESPLGTDERSASSDDGPPLFPSSIPL